MRRIERSSFSLPAALPRPYPVLRDSLFWVITGLYLLLGTVLTIIFHDIFAVHSLADAWPGLVMLGILLICGPGLTYWILWDTWRWDIPERTLYVTVALLGGILGVSRYFFVSRPEYIARAQLDRGLDEPLDF